MREPWAKSTSVAGGLSFWQLQILLVGVAVAVLGIFWLLQGVTNPTSPVDRRTNAQGSDENRSHAVVRV
jgi:hypothetical protein